jgi:cell wall-associated NlpC family hydrolase
LLLNHTASQMTKYFTVLLIALLMASCGSSKSTKTTSKRDVITSRTYNKGASRNIVNFAKTFKGTKYKYGGTTRKGMDCSGLVFVAFRKENISLPRVSRNMAKRGKKISPSKANEGDLVFFRTNKNKKTINHVGLVTSTKNGTLQFIHSTTRRGVIISSLDERYWKDAFVEVRTML